MAVRGADYDPARLSVPADYFSGIECRDVNLTVDIRHVQEMLGHSKLDTTEKYLQVTAADLKEAHRRCHPREREA